MFPMHVFLSSPDYIFMTRLSMEHKNKAKGMRKWREKQEEKKKAIKKDEIHQLYKLQSIMGKTKMLTMH